MKPHDLVKHGCSIRKATLLAAGALAISPLVYGQTDADKAATGGIRLYSITSSLTTTSVSVPAGAPVTLSLQAAELNSDTALEESLSIGWQKGAGRTTFAVSYTPTYSFRLHSSAGSILSHAAVATLGRQFGTKLSLSLGGSVMMTNLTEFAFAPSALSQIVSVPSSFDQFSSALGQNTSTNQSLNNIVSAPSVNSPDAPFVFGNRLLMMGTQAVLSYQLTHRLQIRGSVDYSRATSQGDNAQAAASLAIIPESSGMSGGVSATYSLDSRTNLGFSASYSRVKSALLTGSGSSAGFSASRKVTERWYVEGSGGTGKVQTFNSIYSPPTGPQYSLGFTCGYKAYAQTFAGSFGRTFQDMIGIGATSSVSQTGAWNYSRPGSDWFAGASASAIQRHGLNGSTPWTINATLITGSIGRRIGSKMSMSAQVIFDRHGSQSFAQGVQVTERSIRISFGWTPNIKLI